MRTGRITTEVLDAAATTRVICKHGLGADSIDIEAASSQGIPVMITPLANCESVAEHTLALILSLTRAVTFGDKRVRAGVFEKKTYRGVELRGKTLGVVGFGRVGRGLCELVAPLGMRVVVHRQSRIAEVLPPHVSMARRLDDLLSTADALALHCPLTPHTRGMISRQTIAQMKRGAFLVNTVRGGLVTQSILFDALRNGWIAGAALDVFQDEPPAPNSRLFGLNNVILTPHIAGTSDSSCRNMSMDAARNVLAVLRGAGGRRFSGERELAREVVRAVVCRTVSP